MPGSGDEIETHHNWQEADQLIIYTEVPECFEMLKGGGGGGGEGEGSTKTSA